MGFVKLPRVLVLGMLASLAAGGCDGLGQDTRPGAEHAHEPAAGFALVLGLSRFAPRVPGVTGPPEPEPAAMEILVLREDGWHARRIEDPESNVFHKLMAWRGPDGRHGLLSAAGSAAAVKFWQPGQAPQVLWRRDFGGLTNRMRDLEAADLDGDGLAELVVATHDQGVVAILRVRADGSVEVDEIDREANTIVHEVEVGDLDGDAVPEIYATPSERNRLDGRVQSGRVVRYVPARREGRSVVAALGNRHAKEILVEDVDGDGRDELYVVVEGVIDAETQRVLEPVEIRRYEAGSRPDGGAVIATVPDRRARFLVAGDVDGDGDKELVLAPFRSGLWLLRPGADPMQGWSIESIDPESGGFEHAAVLTDLDGDGRDELYAASDDDAEVRRYVWQEGRVQREVIHRREAGDRPVTWSLLPVPVEWIP